MFLIRLSARRCRSTRFRAGGLVLAGWLGLVTLAQGAETNRPPAEVVIPKSVFVSEGDVGKDPFFPNSTRTKRRAPEDPVKKPVQQDLSQLLVLKGITGPPDKRIALITNLPFAKDEEGEGRARHGRVRIML